MVSISSSVSSSLSSSSDPAARAVERDLESTQTFIFIFIFFVLVDDASSLFKTNIPSRSNSSSTFRLIFFLAKHPLACLCTLTTANRCFSSSAYFARLDSLFPSLTSPSFNSSATTPTPSSASPLRVSSSSSSCELVSSVFVDSIFNSSSSSRPFVSSDCLPSSSGASKSISLGRDAVTSAFTFSITDATSFFKNPLLSLQNRVGTTMLPFSFVSFRCRNLSSIVSVSNKFSSSPFSRTFAARKYTQDINRSINRCFCGCTHECSQRFKARRMER